MRVIVTAQIIFDDKREEDYRMKTASEIQAEWLDNREIVELAIYKHLGCRDVKVTSVKVKANRGEISKEE